MRKLVFLLVMIPFFANAQIIDQFTDGNFTANPTWNGDVTQFQMSTYSNSSWSQQPRLQLNGSVADISYLYVDNDDTLNYNYEWDFWVRLAFNTSTTNNCRIYLMADNTFLEGSLNGYFILIGDDADASIDSVSLCKQTGTTVQKLIHGHNIFSGATGNYRIKVTRSAAGAWSLFTDATGGQNLVADGTATDNTYDITKALGVYCKYTATNKTAFYFDDFYAGAEIVDITPPTIVNVTPVSTTQLDVRFSEIVEQASAETLTNYSVNTIGNPTAATKDITDGTLVHLTFATAFTSGNTYTLTTQNVMDLSANAMVTSNNNFAWYSAQMYDVVINEIMADPDPAVGLPNFEYLELKNNTNLPLSLKNWKLSIGSSTLVFPEVTIAADSFLLVMEDTAALHFAPYGTIVDFPSFSITNSGAVITLRKDNGQLMHTLTFSDTWYQNSSKSGGGWSIEQIDPLNPCAGASNWSASVDPSGGTPGHRNSINASNPDLTAPVISNAGALTPLSVKVTFSEAVDSTTIANPASYTIDNGIGTATSVVVSSPDFKSVIVYFTNALLQNTVYTIILNDTLTDCSGNMTMNPFKAFSLYQAKVFDVQINEIMFDPDPPVALPNQEYVELYNRSNFPVSLIGWTLVTGTTVRTIADATIDAGGTLILCASGKSSLFAPYGAVAEVSGLSLTNSGELLTLLDTNNKMISFVEYSSTWIAGSKANGGWSLEQMDPNNPCGGFNNWDASVDPAGGTPGKGNSIAASNPDNERPRLLRASVTRLERNVVYLYFDESLDSNSLMNLSRYEIDNGIGTPVAIKQYGPGNEVIGLRFPTALQYDIIYHVTVKDSVRDCVGNMIAVNSSVRVGVPYIPDSGSVVINEVLYYPVTGGEDYVELYNRGTKIHDLADLNLSGYDLVLSALDDVKAMNEDGFLLFPGDYVALTADPDVIKESYTTSNPDQFNAMSMPSYNSDSGTVVISTKTGTIIDYFHYTSSMQFPLLTDVKGVSLERIDYNRPASDKTNWHSAAKSVGFGTPAYKNSQYLEALNDDGAVTLSPEIFSPDGDGYNDVLNISYKFGEPGYVATITIFDEKGRLVRKLVNNELLATEGTFSWDGITEDNLKGNIGMYIVYFEVFDIKGDVKHYKKVAVLATKL